MATIHAVSISTVKHQRKEEVDEAELRVEHGLVGDAHAGSDRQVSLLALEAIERMREKMPELVPGDFAENLTTTGLALEQVAVGARLWVGSDVLLEITQIGKVCHRACNIRKIVGDCVMPREGIFARVLQGGTVRKGDEIVFAE
ncbi:MAG: MOSC domain-containing protein [Desulfovibrionales bacterium]